MSEIPLIIGVLQSKMPLGDNFPSTWQLGKSKRSASLGINFFLMQLTVVGKAVQINRLINHLPSHEARAVPWD